MFMKNKVLYGIMTLVFNCYGVPQFMAGEVGKGIGHIALTLFTFGVGSTILGIIGIINGIKILCMSQADYNAKYLGITEAPAEAE